MPLEISLVTWNGMNIFPFLSQICQFHCIGSLHALCILRLVFVIRSMWPFRTSNRSSNKTKLFGQIHLYQIDRYLYLTISLPKFVLCVLFPCVIILGETAFGIVHAQICKLSPSVTKWDKTFDDMGLFARKAAKKLEQLLKGRFFVCLYLAKKSTSKPSKTHKVVRT